jgi:mannose-6-phosphate isomerase-like protein (cupin superfamily)
VSDVINIAEKFTQFSDQWSPKIVADLNDSHIKLAKIEGEFVWHHHEHEDEMFLIIKGTLHMQYRDRTVTAREGEFIVVPKGVEHCPKTEGEVHIMLIEPKSTLHTGDTVSERTVKEYQRI